MALINGVSLTLTSIGRHLPGVAQVKNKIKRIDRLPGNEFFHRDIPLIFKSIISMLTSQLSLCVITVDWSGYRIFGTSQLTGWPGGVQVQRERTRGQRCLS